MPAITLTPGSSTSNVIRLTYNAGALNTVIKRTPASDFNTDGVSLERYIGGYNNSYYIFAPAVVVAEGVSLNQYIVQSTPLYPIPSGFTFLSGWNFTGAYDSTYADFSTTINTDDTVTAKTGAYSGVYANSAGSIYLGDKAVFSVKLSVYNGSSANNAVGIGSEGGYIPGSAIVDPYPFSFLGGNFDSVGFYDDGTTYAMSNVQINTFTNATFQTNNAIIDVAVDRVNHKMWYRVNGGGWQGNDNGRNGDYSYLVMGQTSLYYWCSSGGSPEPGPVQATSIISSGGSFVSALRNGIRYSVLGGTVRTADFIQAGYTYVLNDIDLDAYFWCTSTGVTESPPVSAAPYAYPAATRYGIAWPVVDVIVTGGGTGTGTGTGTGYDNNGSFSYVVQSQDGTFYWASSGGTPEPGPQTANHEIYDGPTLIAAQKNGTTYNVLGLVTADFIQAGYGYVLNDIDKDNYTWCNSSQVVEEPPVDASPYDNETAYRYGIIWNVFTLFTTGGGPPE
jgi:hypothetical protein